MIWGVNSPGNRPVNSATLGVIQLHCISESCSGNNVSCLVLTVFLFFSGTSRRARPTRAAGNPWDTGERINHEVSSLHLKQAKTSAVQGYFPWTYLRRRTICLVWFSLSLCWFNSCKASTTVASS